MPSRFPYIDDQAFIDRFMRPEDAAAMPKFFLDMMLRMADKAAAEGGRAAAMDPTTTFPFKARGTFSHVRLLIHKRAFCQFIRQTLNIIACFWRASRSFKALSGAFLRAVSPETVERFTEWFHDTALLDTVHHTVQRALARRRNTTVVPPFHKLKPPLADDTVLLAYVIAYRPTAVFFDTTADMMVLYDAARTLVRSLQRILRSGHVPDDFVRHLYAYMLRLQTWEARHHRTTTSVLPELERSMSLVHHLLLGPSRFAGPTLVDHFPRVHYHTVVRPQLERQLDIAPPPQEPLRDLRAEALARLRILAQAVADHREYCQAYLRNGMLAHANAFALQGTLAWVRHADLPAKPTPAVLFEWLARLVVADEKNKELYKRIEILRWDQARLAGIRAALDAIAQHRLAARAADGAPVRRAAYMTLYTDLFDPPTPRLRLIADELTRLAAHLAAVYSPVLEALMRVCRLEREAPCE